MHYEILLLIVVIAGFGVLFYLHSRKPKPDQGMGVMLEWLREMRESTDSLQKRLDDRLGETNKTLSEGISQTNKAINERLDKAAHVIQGLQKELGGMTQIGPDIRRLSEVLASPKARGNFGEEMLEQLIRQVMPAESFHFQHRFRSGDVVDAIIRIGEQILCIDSKFSIENFRLFKEAKTEDAANDLKKAFLRDVKKRVDEIHKKYILPQEGTFDFAYMYIPNEGVFSEILEDTVTNNYAREKRVVLVSPNNLYHQLRLTLLYLGREKVNKAAHQLLSMINGIRQESEKFGKNLEVLANHVKNTGNSMGLVLNDYTKLKMSIQNAASLNLEEEKVDEPKLLDS